MFTISNVGFVIKFLSIVVLLVTFKLFVVKDFFLKNVNAVPEVVILSNVSTVAFAEVAVSVDVVSHVLNVVNVLSVVLAILFLSKDEVTPFTAPSLVKVVPLTCSPPSLLSFLDVAKLIPPSRRKVLRKCRMSLLKTTIPLPFKVPRELEYRL